MSALDDYLASRPHCDYEAPRLIQICRELEREKEKDVKSNDWILVLVTIGFALFIGALAMDRQEPYKQQINDMIWNKGPWLTMEVGEKESTFRSEYEIVRIYNIGDGKAPLMTRSYP